MSEWLNRAKRQYNSDNFDYTQAAALISAAESLDLIGRILAAAYGVCRCGHWWRDHATTGEGCRAWGREGDCPCPEARPA